MGTDDAFPTFSKFLDSIHAANHEEYASRPAARVRDTSEFDVMRQHILDMYEGVEVQHSFVDPNGHVFDCIPVEQQPSLRGAKPAAPPDAPSAQVGHDRGAVDLPAVPQLTPQQKDRFGHSMTCPPGTIAVRRVTLDELTKHETLRDFFRKSPWGGRHPRLSGETKIAQGFGITPGVHKWAHAYQVVDTLGGHSLLNLWAPGVGSQIFSLSQQWHAGGSPVQTVEIGWQVYPGKWHTANPALFVYWTADGYQHTGSYNLDGPGFVQTNNRWALGGAVGPLSSYGGAQYTLEMNAYLSGGNWWLYAGGGSSNDAIGYYPASLYGTGPLATHATDVDYGGEVVDVSAWPPMGSGNFANAGWQWAAYQRDIGYYPIGGGRAGASLTPSQASANCFTINVLSTSAPWNEYFFFGGPGGTGCT
jgi:hypothetical protein